MAWHLEFNPGGMCGPNISLMDGDEELAIIYEADDKALEAIIRAETAMNKLREISEASDPHLIKSLQNDAKLFIEEFDREVSEQENLFNFLEKDGE